MEVRPGYKQTEVGVIPQSWMVAELQQVCGETITYGIVQCGPHIKNGVPYIRVSDMDARELDVTGMLRTSPAIAAKFARSTVKEADIVYALRGKLGEVRKVGRAVAGANLTQGTAKLSPKPTVNSVYLLWAMRGQRSLRQAELEAKGTTFREITLADLRRIKVPLPSPVEQETIAEALSDADALIEALERLIAKKRHIKQGAMQELLTGKRRVPGFAIRPRYKQTEVGVIPEDWEIKALGSFCEIFAGRDLVKEDFSPTFDHRHEFPIYSNALTNKGLYGYSKTYQFEPNKITVTARGDIGNAVYRSTRFCAIGRLLVLSSKEQCDLRFVTEYINNFVDFALESTGVPQLTAPQISQYAVALPPIKAEQTAIAAILSDMDAEIAVLEEKLAKARQLKQGMMQELLTGRIRLV